jgi:hypothetical protein
VRKEAGETWLAIVKKNMLEISSSFNKYSGKLMVQSDYRAVEGSIKFLQ